MQTNLYQQACDDFRRQLLAAALAATHGNRTLAARMLGMQRTYLLRCLRALQLAAPAGGRAGRPATVHKLPPRLTITVEVALPSNEPDAALSA